MSNKIRGMEFTSAQAKAVKTLDKNLAINAGAGSGKTRVLTERFLEILLTPQKQGGLLGKDDALDRIVAITFTKKAASEMKGRIRERLEESLEEGLIAQEKRDWALKLVDELSNARISTIHSFCNDIIRKNLFRFNLKGDFEIVKEAQRDNLIEEAIIKVLDRIKADKADNLHEKLTKLVYLYGKAKLVSLFKEMLEAREGINRFLEQVKLEEVKKVLDRRVYNQNLELVLDYLADEEFNRIIEELKGYTPKRESKGVEVVQEIVTIVDKLLMLRDSYQKNPSSKQAKRLLELHYQFLSSFYDEEKEKELKIGRAMKAADWEGGNDVKKAAYRGFEDLKELVPKAGKKPIKVTGEAGGEIIKSLFKLYQEIIKKYQDLKNEQGLVDFIDLEEKVVQLFESDYNLVKDLRAEIDFIMVDEFQDTNRTQWKIINPLVTKDQEFKQLEKGKLFVVGDPKQSIYGFRRADVRIFNQVIKEITKDEESGELIELRKNFRSNWEMIDFVNHIFPKIMEDENQYDVDYLALDFGREVKYGDKIAGGPDSEIEVLLTPDRDDEEYSDEEYEAQLIADKIEWLVNDSNKQIFKNNSLATVDYGDIAILMKTRTKLKVYEAALEEAGIPYNTVKGKGFYQRQEVYDIYLALKALLYPEDDLNIYGLMRSPLFALSDDELFRLMREVEVGEDSLLDLIFANYTAIKNKFSRWQKLSARVGLDRLIDNILTDCGVYSSSLAGSKGEQRRANLEKLLQEAAEFNAQRGNNLYLFSKNLEYLMEEQEREGEEEVELEDGEDVKLMTVHAAKGKEFPVVFMVDLNNRGRSETRSFLCDDIDGQEEIGVRYYNEQLKSVKSSSYKAIKDNLKLKDKMEAKRVFYVGVTRAEEMLFLSARVRVSSRKNIKLYQSLKYLMQGLGYGEQDLVDFLDGEERKKVEKIVGRYGEVEVKLTKNETDIKEQTKDDKLEQVDQDLSLDILLDNFKTEKELVSPSALAKSDVVTSSKTKGSNRLSLLRNNERAKLKGTLVHQSIELLSKGGEVDFDYLFNSHLKAKEYPNLKEEVVKIVEKVEGCPQFNEIIANESRAEIEFYLEGEDKRIIGAIDLIFKDDNDNWAVVDWKTNQVGAIDDLVVEYRPQIEVYKEAIKELTGQKQVKGYLYFTEADKGDRLS